MNAQQKIYSVITALEEASEITPANSPILLHYDSKYLRHIQDHELTNILEKLALDERVIEIFREPKWAFEALPLYLGPQTIEESFEIEILPQFKKFAESYHRKFKDYVYDDKNECFEKRPKKAGLKNGESKLENKSPKELNSLFKLVLGMAVAAYKYDPKKSRNEAIGDIAQDLQRVGIPLDPDTIRKWLKEASETHSVTESAGNN